MSIGKGLRRMIVLDIRDTGVVGGVGGTVVVGVGAGVVGIENLLEGMEGTDLSSLGHWTGRIGGYVETIIVSGPSSVSPEYTNPSQIMVVAHAAPTPSTITETTWLYLRS